MASPPDVILVLSPRMARFVAEACMAHSLAPNVPDDWADTNQALDALRAVAYEVSEQLSGASTTISVADAAEALVTRRQTGTDVAQHVADKMAKAARAAVDPPYTPEGDQEFEPVGREPREEE